MADEHGARGVPPEEPSDQDRPRERENETTYDPDEPDFADEHNSTTFAGEVPGGLERVEEPESPDGLAGLEPEWPGSDTA